MAAPEGNQYALGNEGGRPPLYSDPQVLEQAIEDYFNPKVLEDTKVGVVETGKREPRDKVTITGLCYHLGFCDKSSFYDYEKKEEFSHLIKRARLRVEMSYEERLQENACTGAIFALKNMGWKDEATQNQNVNFVNWDEIKTYAPKPQTD